MRNEFRNEPRTYTKIICNQITEGLRLLSRELYKTFHLWKRTISFKSALVGDMLLPRKVCFEHLWLLYIFTNKKLLVPTRTNKKHWHLYIYIHMYRSSPSRMQPPNKKNGDPNGSLNSKDVFFFFENYWPQEPWKRTASPRAFDLAFDLASFLPFREKLSLKTAPTNCLEASHIEKNMSNMPNFRQSQWGFGGLGDLYFLFFWWHKKAEVQISTCYWSL